MRKDWPVNLGFLIDPIALVPLMRFRAGARPGVHDLGICITRSLRPDGRL